MDVVFAMASAHVGGPDPAMTVFVRVGTHWLASDPVVKKNPAMFSTDPRFGLCASVPLPASWPQADPAPAAAAPARGRRSA